MAFLFYSIPDVPVLIRKGEEENKEILFAPAVVGVSRGAVLLFAHIFSLRLAGAIIDLRGD